MPRQNTLEQKIVSRIMRLTTAVVLREDFEDLGGYDQVGRILRQLSNNGKLIKIGYGLYAKAELSPLSGEIIPTLGLPALAKEALERLHVEMVPTSLEQDYNSGKSTQVPTGRLFAVKGRVSRKIGYRGNYINYEYASR